MSEPRYLPPGSMRKERRSGRIEGFLIAALAFVVAQLMLLFLALLILRGGAGVAVSTGCCAQRACNDPSRSEPIRADPGLSRPEPFAAQPVPEPGTLALIAAGTLALWRLT